MTVGRKAVSEGSMRTDQSRSVSWRFASAASDFSKSGGGSTRVPINEIKVSFERRKAAIGDIQELADSIREIGMLNPITVSRDHTLIAGFHRLEAVKLLGWTEIECTVTGLEGLQAELAEIDENFVRCDLTPIEFGELLLRRKEIYEALHPESIQTNIGGPFRGNQHREVSDKMTQTSKSFAQDTAEKLGIGRRTVERQVQIAKNLTPETKEIIRASDTFITRKEALALSRLESEKQAEAATLLTSGEIQSVDEYAPPVRAGPIASMTTNTISAELADFANLLQRIGGRCSSASLANLSPVQLENLRRQMNTVQDTVQKFEKLLEVMLNEKQSNHPWRY